MYEINDTPKAVFFIVIMLTALLAPLSFILMWGPKRFEKRDKR